MESSRALSEPDTTYRRPIRWRTCSATHQGAVRRLNEDAVLSRADCDHWAVADGMGGHEVGDLASQKIVEALDRLEVPEHLADAVDCVEDCVLGVNRDLQHYALSHLDGATMGSTLVDVVIRGRIGICFWAGDSRLYRYRRQQLNQLTRDHSQVEDMVQMGLISREEAHGHQCSNVITRAVGVEERLHLDLRLFDVQVGDLYLLCSDGLHGAVESSRICEILDSRDPELCVDELMEAAMEAGAPDNISVVVIKGEPGRVSATGRDQTREDTNAS